MALATVVKPMFLSRQKVLRQSTSIAFTRKQPTTFQKSFASLANRVFRGGTQLLQVVASTIGTVRRMLS